MKWLRKISFLLPLMLVLALALPSAGLAAGLETKLIIGNTYTLANGETLNEDLNILGGTVTLEEGSTVNGNILVMGGNVSIAGQVNGDIKAAGGTLRLEKTAVITGSIQSAGVILDRQEGAVVKGTITNEDNLPVQSPKLNGRPIQVFRDFFTPFLNVIGFLVWVFILSALSVLVVMFLPSHTERINQAVMTQPLISFGFGLITIVVAPFAVVALCLTLLLIPAVPLLIFALLALIFLGWVACGYEVGRRFARMLNREWAAPLTAGLGTLALTFVLGSLSFIPCIGWLPGLFVACAGLGAVLLTSFGRRPYQPGGLNPVPPAPRTAATAPSGVTPATPAVQGSALSPALQEAPEPPAADASPAPAEPGPSADAGNENLAAS